MNSACQHRIELEIRLPIGTPPKSHVVGRWCPGCGALKLLGEDEYLVPGSQEVVDYLRRRPRVSEGMKENE